MNRLQPQHGIILVGAMIVAFFFMVTTLAVAEMGISHYVSTRRTLIGSAAMNAADGGADAFMNQISQSSTYQGTNNAPSNSTNSCSATMSPVTLVNNSIQGKITYQSCVANGTIANEKLVYSTGKVYLPATSSSPIVTREVRLVINSSSSGGYEIQTGPGGLTLSNSASIGVGGSIYIGGQLTMSNTATIGTALTPTQVYIANDACGSGASYPTTCTQGQGPAGDGAVLCCGILPMIYGGVHIVNFPLTSGSQNSSEKRTAGLMTLPGLVDNTVPSVTLPADNRQAVLGSCTGSGASEQCSNFPTHLAGANAGCPFGQLTTTWAGGTHFSGNINVSNLCTVTVTGPIWISGNFVLSNTAILAVATGVATAPTIFVDGSGGFQPSNSSALISNLGGVGFNVITFWSAAPCSPDCTSVTGTDLQNSVNQTTIQLSNSFSGLGSTFYARWSKLTTSNATSAGSVAGQTVALSNAGAISLGGLLAGGGTTTWSVKHYEEIYP